MLLLTDLPHHILWIILEHYMQNITTIYYNKTYSVAYKCMTWGKVRKFYPRLEGKRLFGKIEVIYPGFQENINYITVCPITLVSLLRSVCKTFKKCIDQNSSSILNTLLGSSPRLTFTKRDYVIQRNSFKKK